MCVDNHGVTHGTIATIDVRPVIHRMIHGLPTNPRIPRRERRSCMHRSDLRSRAAPGDAEFVPGPDGVVVDADGRRTASCEASVYRFQACAVQARASRTPPERRLKPVGFRFFSGSCGFVRGMSRARDDHCGPRGSLPRGEGERNGRRRTALGQTCRAGIGPCLRRHRQDGQRRPSRHGFPIWHSARTSVRSAPGERILSQSDREGARIGPIVTSRTVRSKRLMERRRDGAGSARARRTQGSRIAIRSMKSRGRPSRRWSLIEAFIASTMRATPEACARSLVWGGRRLHVDNFRDTHVARQIRREP